MSSDVLVVVVAVVAGAVSAVTGFGIGSLLTPVLALALSVDTRVAVAAVSIPHVIGTAVRFWLLHGGIDRRVLWSFGLTSAAGGLVGAALYSIASNRWLNAVFGVLLLFAAVSEFTGLVRRRRFRGWVAWFAGTVSGLLGGLVGNQGGIRSAALLGFDLPKEKVVGTATAIAVFVDGARLPIYIAYQRDDMIAVWPWILLATAGVVGGTFLGQPPAERSSRTVVPTDPYADPCDSRRRDVGASRCPLTGTLRQLAHRSWTTFDPGSSKPREFSRAS